MNLKAVLLVALFSAIVSGAAVAATGDELLSGLTDQERSWVEGTCPRSLGPSIYLGCVETEVAAIRAGIPDVSGLPDDQQAWVRDTCPESLGPSVYAGCLRTEMSALRGGSGDLDSLDPEMRQWVEESCPRSLGPSIYTSCVKGELRAIKRQSIKSMSGKTGRESPRQSSRKSEQASESRSGARPPHKEERDSANTWIAIILLVFAAVLLLPIVWVLFSSRSHGGAKFGWFLVVVFFSWLGFAVFLILTQKPRDAPAE